MIFSQEKYFKANEIPNYHLFQWESSNGDFSLQMAYCLDNQKAISIPSAPYAGLEITGSFDPSLFRKALESMIDSLERHNALSIEIKQAPICVTPLPSEFFVERGFQIQQEINHHINLETYKYDQLHKMQQRRVQKCEKQGFRFQEENLDQAEDLHTFLSQCREQQGLLINITKTKFLRVVQKLPENFRIFSVFTPEGKRCAATVCIKVNQSVTYNYLPAFDRTFSAHSPLAFLLHQLCLQLQLEKYESFDLGISSIQGQPQDTLIDFKERMGGLISDRLTFFKQL